MTTTFLLVRHAVHAVAETVLVGRMANVRLGAEGRRQARELARHLSDQSITLVQSSPRERAEETAREIARSAGVTMEIAPAIDEIDFGGWTGRRFLDLDGDPRWRRWNEARTLARPPDGESIAEVEERAVGAIERLRAARPGGRIVVVSHAEVIRTIVLHYLGLTLDAFARIEISPASVSTLVVGDWGAKIAGLNQRVGA